MPSSAKDYSDYADGVSNIKVEGADINLLDPPCISKLKKVDLVRALNKYTEIIVSIRENNNKVVDAFREAHDAFVSLAHCVHHASSPEEKAKVDHLAKMVCEKEEAAIKKMSQSQNCGGCGEEVEETFTSIQFEGEEYDRCVGGADHNKVFNDNMDWVGFWESEKGEIVFRK